MKYCLCAFQSQSKSESTAVVVNESATGEDVEEADATELVKSRRADGDGWETMTDDFGTVSSTRDA